MRKEVGFLQPGITFKRKWVVPMALNSRLSSSIRNKFRIYLMNKPLAFCGIRNVIVPDQNSPPPMNIQEVWPRFNRFLLCRCGKRGKKKLLQNRSSPFQKIIPILYCR
ncbi:hypothetical protein NIASO_14265 [Niabella soli DSM 19437]|uniref:Uncharacterized protein n=1 Tax=Niabella soli DSM 19437 TaxID=929713 RepID=W0F405_9BACT|nr:hypothetical protein NIASO_14265 [Niabella soli DSM 19437]